MAIHCIYAARFPHLGARLSGHASRREPKGDRGHNLKINLHKAALCGATGLSALIMLCGPAYAQNTTPPAEDEASAGEAIVVTGSRIQRRSVDTLEPTIIVGSDLFENRGFTNAGDALRTIPAFGPPAGSGVGTQAGSFGSGQTFIDFFGLGSQRTLTLVNSRRFVSSNTTSIFGPVAAGSQVDFNTIPTLAIDRLETVAVGGAPIYGSDAIAGTVNILLKQKYQGVKLDAQTGIADEGDAASYRLGILAGTSFGGGRGNIVGSFEWNKQEGLLYSDRARTAAGLSYAAPNGASQYSQVLIKDRRIPALSQYGAPTSIDSAPGFGGEILDASGNALVFDAKGNLTPLDFGDQHPGINSSGGNGLSLVPLTNLLSPTERYLGYIHGDYEVTDHIKVFAEFNYARSKGTELRAQPVYNTWLFDDAGTPDGNLIIPLSNPFLSPAARATIASQLPAGQDYFYLGRANTDITAGVGSTTVELYRITGGLEGDFSIGAHNFKWEVVGNYGRSHTNGSSRELVQQNFENALAGCTGASSPLATISSTCVPFNPFGNQNGPEVADYITTVAHPTATNEEWVVTADVTGDLFNTWAGGVDFALGYEHRNEKARFDPGEFFYGIPDPTDPTADRGQYGRSIPIDPVRGSYNTDEVFGELNVPLISPEMGLSFLRSAELHTAGRYVNNSLAGSDFTWTAGGKINFIEDFGIRGNFTRSIRAPAITELFNPSSAIFTTAEDPCDSRFITTGPNPANRAANCAAAGLPANFTSNIVDFTSRGSLSGNTDLENEKANSWTVGLIVTPKALPGFSLSVDWVNVSLKNAIVSLDADQTMAACYDATSFPSPVCSQIDRGADGQVDFIRTGYINAASYKYRGLLADLTYIIQTPFLGADSSILLKGGYQYNSKLEQRVGVGDLDVISGGVGYPKHKGTASIAYKNGGFGAFTQIQYIGKSQVDPNAAPNTYEYPTRKAVAYVSGSLSYDINDSYTLRFMVDNIFDTNAPYPAPAGTDNSVVTYWDGILGRYFKVGVSAKF
ncbi:TonB-dependent receptor [Novosphingobium sp. PhB165]|uniref:TonB-dependent receptor domain-containing protein n=1 Tax=Novosphingobium sp. PhB165 TaxID=2485105 RepID=UPI001043E5EF|nr:TonB-dependent receptor [Novosphingobium sp. PhB165]